jgi:hypothetical protein
MAVVPTGVGRVGGLICWESECGVRVVRGGVEMRGVSARGRGARVMSCENVGCAIDRVAGPQGSQCRGGNDGCDGGGSECASRSRGEMDASRG